jgi:hypothetical protein
LRPTGAPGIVAAFMAHLAHIHAGLRLREQLAIVGVIVAGPQRVPATRSL